MQGSVLAEQENSIFRVNELGTLNGGKAFFQTGFLCSLGNPRTHIDQDSLKLRDLPALSQVLGLMGV